MSNEEIVEYVFKHDMLPENVEQKLYDIDLCFKILEKDDYFINEFPVEIQKKIIEENSKYLGSLSIDSIEVLLEDEKFKRDVFEDNLAALLELRGLDINDSYIKDLFIAYLKGEKPLPEEYNSDYRTFKAIYAKSIPSVKEDYDVCKLLLDMNIQAFSFIKNKELRRNSVYLNQYISACPWYFENYVAVLSDVMTEETLANVLRRDINYYKIIDPAHPLMKKFYSSIEKIKIIYPEFTLDNPALRYDLLYNDKILNLDPNILRSLFIYHNNAVDKIIKIMNDGRLDYLLFYIKTYQGYLGYSPENIQKAIFSFECIEKLLEDIVRKGANFNEVNFINTIFTSNKFNFETVEDLNNSHDNIVREYYQTLLNSVSTIEEIKNIYSNMLFNGNVEDTKKVLTDYFNGDVNSFKNECLKRNLEFPFGADFLKRIVVFNRMLEIDSLEQLKEYFDEMPLITFDLEIIKKRVAKFYSEVYGSCMFDLRNLNNKISNISGVDVINLDGQNFNMLIHRIFNFDFNMDSITRQLIEDPLFWNKAEGTTTISASFISDKKIRGVFRSLKNSSGTEFYVVDPETEELERQKTMEKERKIHDGDILTEVDPSAVFYGFTDIKSDSILKMDYTDMMVEHGKGKLDIKTSRCGMMFPEDLAYWTSASYWNEVALRRRKTDVIQGNDRMQPTCIVCFDNNINQESILAAKSFGIPIVNIERQKYLDKNKEELKIGLEEYVKKFSSSSLNQIFYNLNYARLSEIIPFLINKIQEAGLSQDKKVQVYYELFNKIEYFIMHSKNYYIADVSIEELNVRMNRYKDVIKELIFGLTNGLGVTNPSKAMLGNAKRVF